MSSVFSIKEYCELKEVLIKNKKRWIRDIKNLEKEKNHEFGNRDR